MLIKTVAISFIFYILASLSFGCAHQAMLDDPVVVAPANASPAAKPRTTRIKYVSVETPETVSAMTAAPIEPQTDTPRSIVKDIVQILWPLLTMLIAGVVLIAGLFIEYKVLSQQLARRIQIKSQLRS
jgi:hypothetical protein